MEKNQLILLNKEDLEALLKELLNNYFPDTKLPYVGEKEALDILGLKSKSYLWALRQKGDISFSQPAKKHIMYNRQSLLDYLKKHENKTF